MSENQEKLNEQLFNVIANSKDNDEGKLKKLKYLVRLGANVNTRLYGRSVLSKAIEKESGVEVQDFLREKGAEEFVISKEEALEISKGFWDDEGYLKSFKEIKELLKKGADLEAEDEDGQTALMWAARGGQLDVVKYLVEYGADLEAKDKDGDTALMVAAIWGTLDVVKCLVECGADLEAKDKDGRTALIKAANLVKFDVVKCLAECGADLEAKNKDGETALMKAAIWGELDDVKCLAECGADLEAKDGDGRTALDIARMWRKADCVKFLEELQLKEEGNSKNGFWQRIFGGRD